MIEVAALVLVLVGGAAAVVGFVLAAVAHHGISSEDEIRKRHRDAEMRARRGR